MKCVRCSREMTGNRVLWYCEPCDVVGMWSLASRRLFMEDVEKMFLKAKKAGES